MVSREIHRHGRGLTTAAGHKVAFIDDEACVGCGECVATCFTGAIGISWKSDPAIVQQKMVEYAAAALHEKEGKFAAINFIIDVTPDCDCLGWSDNPIVPNIGIAASLDPVSSRRRFPRSGESGARQRHERPG